VTLAFSVLPGSPPPAGRGAARRERDSRVSRVSRRRRRGITDFSVA